MKEEGKKDRSWQSHFRPNGEDIATGSKRRTLNKNNQISVHGGFISPKPGDDALPSAATPTIKFKRRAVSAYDSSHNYALG